MLRDIEWNTFETMYAMDSFAKYWSESEALIKKAADDEEEKSGPKWTPKNEDELGEYHMERNMARHLHEEIMTPMLRYSCAVLLYTIVERELRRLVRTLEKEHGEQKLKFKELRGSFLQQVGKFTEVFFGLSLSGCPDCSAVCDLQKIRDCIVHCRGEVNLVNETDRKYLLQLEELRPGFSAWEGTDIVIEAQCIEQFIRQIWRFFTWVFHQLKWPIHDSWKDSQSAQPVRDSKVSESKKQ